MHLGLVGMTRSGKTTLAAAMCRGLVKRRRRVAVLDRMKDPRWAGAELVTADPAEFLAWAQSNLSAWLFADEWGSTVGRAGAAAAYDWLGTTSRHHGHSVAIIAHRWTQITPTLRDGLERVFAFTQGRRSADVLAEEFNVPELADQLPRLERGKFMEVGRFTDVRAGTVEFPRGRVKWQRATVKKAA